MRATTDSRPSSTCWRWRCGPSATTGRRGLRTARFPLGGRDGHDESVCYPRRCVELAEPRGPESMRHRGRSSSRQAAVTVSGEQAVRGARRPAGPRSLAAASRACDGVVLVVPSSQRDRGDAARDRGPVVVTGGATRSASVRRASLRARRGLRDRACTMPRARSRRPSCSDAVIAAVREGADAAVPGVPVVDTIKQIRLDGGHDRPDTLVAVQTPQAFAAADAAGRPPTGRRGLRRRCTRRSARWQGRGRARRASNIKITEPDDLTWACGIVAAQGAVDR
jgi:2-C-methyl-D-erythritol 4-phosphate cytidylyltransferase